MAKNAKRASRAAGSAGDSGARGLPPAARRHLGKLKPLTSVAPVWVSVAASLVGAMGAVASAGIAMVAVHQWQLEAGDRALTRRLYTEQIIAGHRQILEQAANAQAYPMARYRVGAAIASLLEHGEPIDMVGQHIIVSGADLACAGAVTLNAPIVELHDVASISTHLTIVTEDLRLQDSSVVDGRIVLRQPAGVASENLPVAFTISDSLLIGTDLSALRFPVDQYVSGSILNGVTQRWGDAGQKLFVDSLILSGDQDAPEHTEVDNSTFVEEYGAAADSSNGGDVEPYARAAQAQICDAGEARYYVDGGYKGGCPPSSPIYLEATGSTGVYNWPVWLWPQLDWYEHRAATEADRGYNDPNNFFDLLLLRSNIDVRNCLRPRKRF